MQIFNGKLLINLKNIFPHHKNIFNANIIVVI